LNGTALDVSGNGNDGTISNALSTTDRFGSPNSALLFDGETSFVSTPLKREDYDPDFSVSAWFRFDGQTADGYQPIVAGDTPSSSGPFFIGKNTGNSNIGIQNDNYVADVGVNTDAWNGEWHHIAVTFEGAFASGPLDGKLYLDGNLVGTSNFSSAGAAASVIFIGHEVDGPTAYFEGAIDDVRFYDEVLSQSQVSNLVAVVPIPAPLLLLTSAIMGFFVWSKRAGSGDSLLNPASGSRPRLPWCQPKPCQQLQLLDEFSTAQGTPCARVL
jgi:hypothetical protein